MGVSPRRPFFGLSVLGARHAGLPQWDVAGPRAVIACNSLIPLVVKSELKHAVIAATYRWTPLPPTTLSEQKTTCAGGRQHERPPSVFVSSRQLGTRL